jgi:hypothetical protein
MCARTLPASVTNNRAALPNLVQRARPIGADCIGRAVGGRTQARSACIVRVRPLRISRYLNVYPMHRTGRNSGAVFLIDDHLIVI